MSRLLLIGSWLPAPEACGLWLAACSLWLAALYMILIGFFTYGWYRGRKSSVFSLQSSVVPGKVPVSLVVSARDEEKFIGDLLDDLTRQDYQEDLTEIIIVDDKSIDNTYKIIEDFMQVNNSSKIILLKTEEFNVSGKKAAIDLAVRRATGEIILTTDADCKVGPGWITAMVNSFKDEKIRMVAGPVSYLPVKGFWNEFQSIEFASLIASGAGAAGAGHPFLCNGAGLAYRKEAFMQVGGFSGNEQYLSGDDVFLLHKVKKAFGRRSVVFCHGEKAIVKTFPAEGFRKFISQRVRWASKSRAYSDPLSIFTALIVFSYSLTVLSSFISGFFNPWFFLLSGGMLVLKMITDFPLLWGVTGFFRHRRLLRWYPVFQVIYPFYIAYAGLLSLFKRRLW